MIHGIQNVSFTGREKMLSAALDSFSASRGVMPKPTNVEKAVTAVAPANIADKTAEISVAYSKAPLLINPSMTVANSSLSSSAASYAASRGIPADKIGAKLTANA